MADIIRHPGASNSTITTGSFEDRVAITFAPAQPTLDAMTKLRRIRNYIAERRRWDPNANPFGHLDATGLLALLPDMATLQHAARLFHEAEHVPAPEEWLYLAFGVMLAAAPNSGKVPVEYTISLVDSVCHDEELHRGYAELGYSFAVVTLAIRQLRRECRFVPSAHEVLEACDAQRRAFRKLTIDTHLMISERAYGEAPPAPPKREAEYSDCPF